MSDEKTKPSLVDRLRKSLEYNRLRETGAAIEKAALARLGDDNFIYVREANVLASVELSALDALLSDVKRIRSEYETEYSYVLAKLGEDNENA